MGIPRLAALTRNDMILKYKEGSQDTLMTSGWSACKAASAPCSRGRPTIHEGQEGKLDTPHAKRLVGLHCRFRILLTRHTSIHAGESEFSSSKPTNAAGFLPIGNHPNDFYAQTAFPEPKNHHQIRGKKRKQDTPWQAVGQRS